MVNFRNLKLQIERVSWRGTLANCNAQVHQHLDEAEKSEPYFGGSS